MLPTDYTFTGQKLDASSNLLYYGARYYAADLGRFAQPDTIVPDPYNPQSLNRYSYVRNNPVRYTDPTGHRAGDEDGSDAACWKALRGIEHDFSNVHFDPANWLKDELLAVRAALEHHIFGDDVATANRIDLIRSTDYYGVVKTGVYVRQVSGLTDPSSQNPGNYTVTIYGSAYDVPPNANDQANPAFHAPINFLGALIHELTHVAVLQNPAILQSYRNAPRDWLPSDFAPIGRDIVGGLMEPEDYDKEMIAVAATVYTLMPDQFSGHIEWIIPYTDPRKAWLDNWTRDHPRKGRR